MNLTKEEIHAMSRETLEKAVALKIENDPNMFAFAVRLMEIHSVVKSMSEDDCWTFTVHLNEMHKKIDEIALHVGLVPSNPYKAVAESIHPE